MIQDVRGDEIVAVFESEAGLAVRAGLAMLRSLREHNRERVAHGSEELRAGIGLNTGPLGVGLVGGVNRMVLTIIGDAVNLAARIESTNKRYGSALLISDQTYRGPRKPRRVRHPSHGTGHGRQPAQAGDRSTRSTTTIPKTLRAAKRSAQPAFDEAFALFDAGDVDGARTAFERCRAVTARRSRRPTASGALRRDGARRDVPWPGGRAFAEIASAFSTPFDKLLQTPGRKAIFSAMI